MNRLNFSDIYRFLVSLGIIFYIFCVTIPWLFFKNNLETKISTSEYNLLTESSQTLVDNTQRNLIFISDHVAKISIGLFIAGSICIFIGLRKWYYKQRGLDEIEKIELDVRRLKLPTLNKEESLEKSKKEEASLNVSTNEEKDITLSEDSNSEQDDKISKYSLYDLENFISKKIRREAPFGAEVKQNLKLDDGSIADVVVQSLLKDNFDRVINILYFSHIIASFRIIETLIETQRFINTYKAMYKSRTIGFVFVVYVEDLNSQQDIQELETTITQFKTSNKITSVSIQLLSLDELPSINFNERLQY